MDILILLALIVTVVALKYYAFIVCSWWIVLGIIVGLSIGIPLVTGILKCFIMHSNRPTDTYFNRETNNFYNELRDPRHK